MKLNPGDIVDGKYRIVRLLGEGGMGAVYEGENQRINRRVAIKVLHAATAAKSTAVRRFEQEARAAGLIGSEHIVEVLDLGSLPSGENYMVMEFLEGETFEARIKWAKRLAPHQAAPIVMQLLKGLAAAHKAGIIHRNLKPENVFLVRERAGSRDFVKIVDFGVSKFSEHETEGMSMTSTGAVVGTPYYLSPEQARGVRQLDGRSDLYSVGVVLYQSVTGRLPFHAETFNELVFKIALESPEPAEVVVPGLDPAFAAIISRAMVRETNGRFQTAEDFYAALAQWLEEHPDAAAGPVGRPARQTLSPIQPGAQGGSGGGAPYTGVRAHGGTVPIDMSAAGLSPSPLPGMGGHTPFPGGPPGAPMNAGAFGAGPPMGGAPGFSQNSPNLSASQGGLTPSGVTMPAAPPKKTGAVVAIAAAIVVCLGGGAFGAYKLVTGGSGQGQASPQATPTASERAQVEPVQAKTAAPTPTQAATAEPTAGSTPSGAPTDMPVAQVGAQPTGPLGPRPSGTAPVAAGTGGFNKKPDTGTAGSATATVAPKPTGRVIGGDL